MFIVRGCAHSGVQPMNMRTCRLTSIHEWVPSKLKAQRHCRTMRFSSGACGQNRLRMLRTCAACHGPGYPFRIQWGDPRRHFRSVPHKVRSYLEANGQHSKTQYASAQCRAQFSHKSPSGPVVRARQGGVQRDTTVHEVKVADRLCACKKTGCLTASDFGLTRDAPRCSVNRPGINFAH